MSKSDAHYMLEALYERLGRPRGFWALVFLCMFILLALSGGEV